MLRCILNDCVRHYPFPSSQELVGTLRGFDDYVNMVLDDVTEYEADADGTKRKVQLDQVGTFSSLFKCSIRDAYSIYAGGNLPNLLFCSHYQPMCIKSSSMEIN